MTLTLDDLRQQNLILLECTSGSRAYGLATATSDTDIKGVFYLPKTHFFSLQSDYLAQISNPSNDIVYYELGRFIELLLQNNPNMMELLATPEACVRYRHPFMKRIRPEWFISKRCEKTFAGFAQSQIKKARGLNKKIVSPMEKRNEARYQSTLNHGKQYDAKNMMHTIRLLQMALEIGRDGKINVARDNRDELLAIKSGEYDYHALLNQANQLGQEIRSAFATSTLPEQPDTRSALAALQSIREQLYGNT